MKKNKKRRYLFFINQDYSYPILRPLEDEIKKRGDEVRWFLYGDEIDYDKLRDDEIRLFSVKEIKNYNPDAVFVPGNVVPSFIPGLKITLFHGLPSNKFTKKGEQYHFIIRGMFDLYCTYGPSSTIKFKELEKKYGHFIVKETGWPKLDPFFRPTSQNNKKAQKTIFFASTFSNRFSKANELYPFIKEMIKKYDFRWYITLHPKMNKDIVGKYQKLENDNVAFLDSTNLNEAFINSNLMLCDTSSIMYEFLTILKPVVTFQTQKEEPCFINTNNIEQLESLIIDRLSNPTKNRSTIQACANHIHPYRDGKSSKRVLDAVEEILDKNLKPKKRKPLNIIRNFKLRRELNYWKFW